MNRQHPFTAGDLSELDERLLSRAAACVPLRDIHDGNHNTDVIGLRHDVDAGHALVTALRIAEWEAERGYRSTFFLLHTSPYWGRRHFASSVEHLVACGHEVGIHTNAVAEALRTGRDPDLMLEQAIGDLRTLGVEVRGVVGHGDPLCNRDRAPAECTFVNDEQFVEGARPQQGEPDRLIRRGSRGLRLAPRPLADFGLEYIAVRAGSNPMRLSDSGGCWSTPFDQVLSGLWERQLHLLWHPDWWGDAFEAAVPALN